MTNIKWLNVVKYIRFYEYVARWSGRSTEKIAEYKHYHMCVYQCILPGECSFTDVDWHHCEGSDPPRTSLKSRIAPQNCCKNNNQWKMLIQLCIRSTKVTAHEIGWTPTRNFGTIWFIRSLYWFFGPIRYASPAPHLIMLGWLLAHNTHIVLCYSNWGRHLITNRRKLSRINIECNIII